MSESVLHTQQPKSVIIVNTHRPAALNQPEIKTETPRSPWSSTLVGAGGIALGALILGIAHEVPDILLRQAIPRDMVMMVAGPCPAGWRRYSAADLRYLIAADGTTLSPGSVGSEPLSPIPPNPKEPPSMVSSQPRLYIGVNLCQLA
jgi:hypothetical protein